MKLSRLLLYAAVGLCVSCQKNGKEVDTPALSVSTRVSGQQGANNFSAWLEGDKMAIDFITGEQVSRLNRNINHITLIINNTSTGTLWFDTVKFPLFLFSQEASFYNNMSILCR